MRTYSWRLLAPLPLAAALAGLLLVSIWTWSGITAAMRSTHQALGALAEQTHAVGHVWVALAEQRTATAEILAAGTAEQQELQSVEQAVEQVHQGLLEVSSSGLTPAQAAAYRALTTAYAVALPRQQRLLHAVAIGDGPQARVLWQQLDPVLRGAQDDAHQLLHATYVAFSPRVSALEARETRQHRRQLLIAFGLVAAEFGLISLWAGRVVARPLASFARAAAAVRRGDLSVRLPSFRIREFAALGQGLQEMINSLRAMRAAEAEMHRRALALREARSALMQRQLDLVIRAQEEERRRVARDLHDEAAQALTAVHLSLERLAYQVGPESRPDVESLAALVRETMEAVRNLAVDLHPHALDELGLLPALGDWVGQVRRRSGVDVRVEALGDLPRFSPALETAAFRIAQEAVTNALRHGHPASVTVTLGLDGDAFVLEVVDNGTGFDARPSQVGVRGMGLFSMQERARQVGGDLTIRSRRGEGTRVRLTVPLGVAQAGGDQRDLAWAASVLGALPEAMADEAAMALTGMEPGGTEGRLIEAAEVAERSGG